MASDNGGPWGGGGNRGGGDRGGRDDRGGGRRPQEPQIPEIDQIVKKGQEQLRVLMGGRGGSGGSAGGSGGGGFRFTRGTVGLGILAILALWVFASLYTVQPEEKGVELFLGKYHRTTGNGLHFAPYPIVKAEVIPVSTERTENIGFSTNSRSGAGLMLTTDENIVDIDFQVVWNINDPAKFLFNLRDPGPTIRAVAESAMRQVIAASELAPILNRDRAIIASQAYDLIQQTLDSYDSGMHVVRVNLEKADPPREVIDSFRAVQAAEQERSRLQREADAYSNKVLAAARGTAAQTIQEAEAYRAKTINDAEGQASRFLAVLKAYKAAPEVTRKRMYLDAMQQVLGSVNKVILDENGAAQGVVPYLPLNELSRPGGKATTGGSN